MKKVLIVATVFKFLNFEVNDIKILKDIGYEIHTATNLNQSEWLKDDGSLDYLGIKKHHIDFGRSPFSINTFKALFQLRQLLKKENFDLVHCHTPVASAIARVACSGFRKKGLKVIYTAHGFHFHKQSSKKSWIIYHTIEKLLASKTDMIITINKEDFEVAKKFKCPTVRYIPGVGIDFEKILFFESDFKNFRSELNLPDKAFVILSIGELSERKNQETIIKAISGLQYSDIYYVVCGTGALEKKLRKLSEEYNISDRVLFLGQRNHNWVLKFIYSVDIGAFPSRIEGLGLAGLEIMAAGKPIVGSNIHGIKDYLIDGETGFSCAPNDVEGFAKAIKTFYEDKNIVIKMGLKARETASNFDIKIVEKLMKENYAAIDGDELHV